MRLRLRPIWLVLLFACGNPQSGTEVGNPTFGCAGSGGANSADGGAGGGGPPCVEGAIPFARCDGVAPCELLDFGEVAVGEEGRVTLVLEHPGCDPVEVDVPELDGGVALHEGPSAATTLLPGTALTLTLAFTPTTRGPTSGDVRILLTPGGELFLPWVATGR